MIYPFRDSISRLNTYISDIIRIFGGIPVKSGLSSVLFQGCTVRDNDITWNVSENWRLVQRTLLVEHGFQFFCDGKKCCKAAHFQVIFFR